MHQLLHVRADADFVVVAHVATHDAALIEHVLDPVDELVAAATRLAFLGRGRGTGEDENGYSPFRRVVNRAGEGLRAAFNMHDDALRAARDLCKAVRRAERDHLVRRSDEFRHCAALGLRARDRFHQRGVIAAEIHEQVLDACLLQRLEHGRAGRVHHALPSDSLARPRRRGARPSVRRCARRA